VLGRVLIWNETVSTDLQVAFLRTSSASVVLYRLPLALGVTVSAVVAWRYWRWLLKSD
jgi:hypothetical protein